jgi:hypothetical protein
MDQLNSIFKLEVIIIENGEIVQDGINSIYKN